MQHIGIDYDHLEAIWAPFQAQLNFNCLNEIALDALVERIVSRIPVQFWTTEWTSKELDTASGRKIVLDALSVIDSNVRYGRTWYDGVGIVDPALVHGQTFAKPKKSVKSSKASK